MSKYKITPDEQFKSLNAEVLFFCEEHYNGELPIKTEVENDGSFAMMTFEDMVEVGTPICAECGCNMELWDGEIRSKVESVAGIDGSDDLDR